MRAWVVRAGHRGQREGTALSEGLVVVGWDSVDDLNGVATRDEIKSKVAASYPDEKAYTVGNWTGQLYRFGHEVEIGDLVVIPLKSSQVAIGRIAGDYEHRPAALSGCRHVRPVEWIVRDADRDRFQPDLLDSMGSLLTVFELSRFDAANRIAAIANGDADPGRPDSDPFAATLTEPARLYEEIRQRGADDPLRLTIRDFLAVWDAQRRYPAVVEQIERDLSDRGLITVPPFTEGSLDSIIAVLPLGDEPDSEESSILSRSGIDLALDDQQLTTAVAYHISNLDSANRTPDAVRVGDSLQSAMTLMTLRGYSQLPVVDGDGRLRGTVSWESIGRARMATADVGLEAVTVKAREANRSDDLLDWIDEIQRTGYVFVRDHDHRVCGVVTSSDLTAQFSVRVRPFVLVEEIERRLRQVVDARISVDRMRAADPRFAKRIHSAANLSLGAYSHLLAETDNWKAIGWAVDQTMFLDALQACVGFRNALMHFSPDPITDEQLQPVQGMLDLLRSLDPQPL